MNQITIDNIKYTLRPFGNNCYEVDNNFKGSFGAEQFVDKANEKYPKYEWKYARFTSEENSQLISRHKVFAEPRTANYSKPIDKISLSHDCVSKLVFLLTDFSPPQSWQANLNIKKGFFGNFDKLNLYAKASICTLFIDMISKKNVFDSETKHLIKSKIPLYLHRELGESKAKEILNSISLLNKQINLYKGTIFINLGMASAKKLFKNEQKIMFAGAFLANEYEFIFESYLLKIVE